MKKLLRKRSLFLVAFLVGLCMPVAAQTATSSVDDLLKIQGVEPEYYDSELGHTSMYYLKNVGTGLFLTYGSEWGTSATEGQTAHPIIVEDNGDGTIAIGCIGGYLSNALWMDRPKAESKWILKSVEGHPGQYHLVGGSDDSGDFILSSIGHRSGKLVLKGDEGKALQRWIFTSGPDIRDRLMLAASEALPMDVSLSFRAGSFDKVDGWIPNPDCTSQAFYEMMGKGIDPDNQNTYHGYQAQYWTSFWGANRHGFHHSGREGDWVPGDYNYCGILRKNGRDDAATLTSYSITLPAGIYRFQFDSFYKCKGTIKTEKQTKSSRNASWKTQSTSTQDITEMPAYVEISGAYIEISEGQSLTRNIPQNNDVADPTSREDHEAGKSAADQFRLAKNEEIDKNFEQDITFYLTTKSQVTFSVRKGDTSTENITVTGQSSGYNKYDNARTRTTTYIDDYHVYLDNFNLYYSGIPADLGIEVVDKPIHANTDANISEEALDQLYRTIYAGEVTQKYVEEYGSGFWLIPFNHITAVYVAELTNQDAFNEWRAAEGDLYFSESLSGTDYFNYEKLSSIRLDNDAYEDALDAWEDYNAALDSYLTTEIQTRYENANKDLIFKNNLEANYNDYYSLLGEEGKDVFEEMMSEWTTVDENGNTIIDRNKINSRVDYFDAIAQMEEAFAYAKQADAQADVNVDGTTDYTGLIFNPSFELGLDGRGSSWGWTIGSSSSSDVRVASNTFDWGRYAAEGMHLNHLFNIWAQGAPITQTVSLPNDEDNNPRNLPSGTYLLSALITSDVQAPIYLIAKPNNNTEVNDFSDGEGSGLIKRQVRTTGAAVFDDYGMRVELNNARNLAIGVSGGNNDEAGSYNPAGHWWYKCDNFRLEYLPNGVLTLKEEAERITNIDDLFHGVKVERSKMSTTKWSTFVVPFSMAVPGDWDVMEITGAEARPFVDENGNEYEDLNLKFASTSKIEAGRPYMVKLKKGAAEGTIRTEVSTSTPNVAVKTRTFAKPEITVLGSGYNYTVEFIGSYTQCTIPNSNDEPGTVYYFVSGNKFYRSTGDGNVMKGFRGYFKVTQTKKPDAPASAKGLRSLAMTRTETDIEIVVDDEEVTVVAIYDVNGIRLNEMKPGINILRMNNGTTKKVMVK